MDTLVSLLNAYHIADTKDLVDEAAKIRGLLNTVLDSIAADWRIKTDEAAKEETV
jgi:hypothetical protein